MEEKNLYKELSLFM